MMPLYDKDAPKGEGKVKPSEFFGVHVQIAVESMRAQIVQYIRTQYEASLEPAVDAAIMRAVQDFDLNGYVSKIVQETLTSKIKSVAYDVIYRNKDLEEHLQTQINEGIRRSLAK